MKKIFQYIWMAVALVATAACSNELDDALQPVENGNLQFVVSDFPAFGEGAQTRAIGTPDAGKTAWEEGDAIFVHLYSGEYGSQVATLTFNAEKSTWTPSGTLNYLENETLTVSAVYAPDCEIKEDKTIGLIEGKKYGEAEYIPAKTTISGNTLDISFERGRIYSRLRIVAEAGQTLTVTTTGFTPAGPEGTTAPNSYTLVTDTPNGNAFLYGTFAEGATVSVKHGDVTLKDYTFTAEKNPNGTEAGKSYALYAGPSFSVSADKKVLFSPGNLQYTQSTETWSFAENQYDMLGKANSENGGLADKIDLFCWSTDNGFAPFGVGTSTKDSDYTGNFVDWGVNQIDDYAPNIWRTLSADEWTYLFEGRENAESLYGVAQVAGVNGMIILADNWVAPDGITLKTGINPDDNMGVDAKYYPEYQSFSAEQWVQMEAAGAVFLPAAGDRYGADHIAYDAINGMYWSSTVVDSTFAYYLLFGASDVRINDWGYISAGWAVRLVKDL